MSKFWKLEQSRDSWKNKAIERGQKARAQQKEVKRLKKARDQCQKVVLEMKAELELQRKNGYQAGVSHTLKKKS